MCGCGTHAATQAQRRDACALTACAFVGPDEGAMACGELRPRRAWPELSTIVGRDRSCILSALANASRGRDHAARHMRARRMNRSTRCAIIANRSSGKQGYAIAAGRRRGSAPRHVLVSGPTNAAARRPAVDDRTRVETAREMLKRLRGGTSRRHRDLRRGRRRRLARRSRRLTASRNSRRRRANGADR